MNHKVIAWLLIFIMLAGVNPCLAQRQGKQSIPTVSEVKSCVSEAKAKDLTVTVKLKQGVAVKGDLGLRKDGTLHGLVSDMTETGFTIVAFNATSSGLLKAEIDYADIELLKRQSKASKVLSKVGEYSLLTVASVAMIPLLILAAITGNAVDC